MLGHLKLYVVSLPLLALAACGNPSSSDTFQEKVVPILESRCADSRCHGALAGDAKHQLDPQRWLTFTVDATGRITDVPGALASVKAKVNSSENVAYSSVLRKTLPVAMGGQFHFKGSLFQSRDDADYRTLADWAATVSDGGEGASDAPLTANEQLFATNVYPLLIDRGCATSTCHGSLMFGGAVFQAPAQPGTLNLSRADLRATYGEAKRNLSLWGNPLQSRLLAKILPLEQGGIAHKGGNDVFLAKEMDGNKDPRDSATVKGVLDWIAAERKAGLGSDVVVPIQPPIVLVGGPLPMAGPFDVAPFTPGSDLYRLDPPYTGAPVNLTASAHTLPADVRDPAISHDGKTIVFSMRKSAEDAHNLYTIGLDGTGLKQLTNDKSAAANGLTVGNFAPTWGPNGGFNPKVGTAPAERIYFSSTRAADLADLASVQNADLYVIDADGANLERLTYTVVPEVSPHFLAVGEFAGTMAYTIKRSAEGGYKGVFFRFPIDHDAAFHIQPEAHPHFGMSEAPQVFYRIRELADGRSTLVLLDENNRWRGGQLAVLERQFAVEIPEGKEGDATLPNFRHALTILSGDAARTGLSTDGLWRDPTPLPDGSLLVAHASGPLDLSDPALNPRTELVHITLSEDRATNRPKVASATVLLTDPKLAWSQPVAAYQRPAEDPPHARKWNDTDKTATLVHSGVQVIEAVLAHLPPTAPRTLREDIAYVRAVVPVSIAGQLDVTPVPAAETLHNMPNATVTSLTGRMPLFAAFEVPPAADGSLAAAIPAQVPVRVVTLDKDHVAVGTLQHQWYATLPGERFPVGIPLTSYNARCGGCHGAMDGQKSSVLQAPTDFITQASVTAAMYEEADRRTPSILPIIDSSFFLFSDFAKDVQPILTAKCANGDCHGSGTPAGGLDLSDTKTTHYTQAYENLLQNGVGSASGYKYVDADGYRARGSFLAEKVMNREYDADRTLDKACPPAGAAQLTDDERLAILRWIEFGAAYHGLPVAK